MRRWNSGIAAWVMYVLVRCAFALMQVFPIEWNLRTARALARVWRRVLPRHFHLGMNHLRAAYGEALSEAELRRIAQRCLESVTMFAVEVICLPRLITPFTWQRYIRLVHIEEALDLVLQGRSIIAVTGHYGSFELMGHLWASLGFEMAAVMRPLDNEHLNRFVKASRATHGLRLIDKRGATAEAEGLLADGVSLGFIGDQDAGSKGMFVEFFGRPASTYKSIGLLAMATQSPIVVGYARRRGDDARYDVGVQRIIHPREWAEQKDPLRWITQVYTSAIEEIVREEPEQYLWIHRRWKSHPRGASLVGKMTVAAEKTPLSPPL